MKEKGESRKANGEKFSKSEIRNPYLSYSGPGTRIIGGVGMFSRGIPAEPVSLSIANQYSTEEMKALGWVVEWK